MNINYKILNPGGNKTALVIGNDYTTIERKWINEKILKENKEVEQVGFISNSEKRLEMAGGEFCVNATRCAIWEYLDGKEGEISINVSGLNEKAEGGITKEKDVYVKMKINKRKDELMKKQGIFNLVYLDGIMLAVVDEANSKKYIKRLKENEPEAKQELKEIMKTFDTSEKAVGIILLEEINKIKIYPIIWVKTIDTLYYETACGSGSLATAIYKCDSQENKFEIVQPSGYSIFIDINMYLNTIYMATISGKIIEEN